MVLPIKIHPNQGLCAECRLYWNRRQILRAMSLTGVGLAGVLAGCKSNQEVEQQIQQRAQILPKLSAERNNTFSLDRPLTEEKVAAHYNNFYAFSSGKDDVWELAAFESEPWKVEITGLVQRPQTLDIDDITSNLLTLRSDW